MMSEADSESSEKFYAYEVWKKEITVHVLEEDNSSTPHKMLTPTTIKKPRHNSEDDDLLYENIDSSHMACREKPKKAELTCDTLCKLTECIERNTEVMQCAMEALDAISQSQFRMAEGDFIIPETKRSDKVTVELKCTFLKISDIDTINQQFEAEIFVQAKWEEPILQQLINKNKEKEELDKLVPWDPKLIVMNIDGAFVLNRKTYDVRFHEPGYTYPVVLQLWRFKGFFKENLELEHFPVDVQDLTISLSTERSNTEVELIEDQKNLSSINTKAFMDQEWSIYKHIETSRSFTTVEYCSSTVHPILHAQCRVARKVGYFIWNIIFIMMLIISLTFAAFTINYDTADRLTVTITLFLTAVAFKLVVKQSLPTISYLTYLDAYVISALMFLSLQAAQNATMTGLSHFLPRDVVDYFDKWSIVALALCLLLFHLIFAIFIYRTASKRRRVMKEKDIMYTAKREFVEKYGSLPSRHDIAMELDKDFKP